jgi:hypothetical protein
MPSDGEADHERTREVSRAIGTAIDELRGQFEYATADLNRQPTVESYVTLVDGPEKMYPAVIDYNEELGNCDGEIIQNSLFEQFVDRLEYDVEHPVPDAVIAETKRISNDVHEVGEDDGN